MGKFQIISSKVKFYKKWFKSLDHISNLKSFYPNFIFWNGVTSQIANLLIFEQNMCYLMFYFKSCFICYMYFILKSKGLITVEVWYDDICAPGQALSDVSRDKPPIRTVESNTTQFMKALESVETGLLKHINYLTTVSTGFIVYFCCFYYGHFACLIVTHYVGSSVRDDCFYKL